MVNIWFVASVSLCVLLQGAAVFALTTEPASTGTVGSQCQAFSRALPNGGVLLYPLPGGTLNNETCEWSTWNSTSGLISIDTTQAVQTNASSCATQLHVLDSDRSLRQRLCTDESNQFIMTNTTSAIFRMETGSKPFETSFFLFYTFETVNQTCRLANHITESSGVIVGSNHSCAWYIAANTSYQTTQLRLEATNSTSNSASCNTFSVYSLNGAFMRLYAAAQNVTIPFSSFILTCHYEKYAGSALSAAYTFREAVYVEGTTPATTRSTTTRGSRTTNWVDWVLCCSAQWTPWQAPIYWTGWQYWTPTYWSAWTAWTSSGSSQSNTSPAIFIVIPACVVVCVTLAMLCKMKLKRSGQQRNIASRGGQTLHQIDLRVTSLPARTMGSINAAGPVRYPNPVITLSPPADIIDPMEVPPSYDDAMKAHNGDSDTVNQANRNNSTITTEL